MLMIGVAAAVKNDRVSERNLSPFISDLFSDDFKLFATELFNMGASKKLIFGFLVLSLIALKESSLMVEYE